MAEEEMKLEEIKPEEPKQEEDIKPEEPKQEEEIKPVENPEEPKDGQEESNGDQATVVVAVAAVPPPPPPEILLKVLMHCEACARKVRRCLKEFPGVENVITDFKSHQVIVKGEKADPMKVLERVQSKSKSLVELLSPIPNPPEEKKLSDEEDKPSPPEKPAIVTVVLKVYMHCEKCVQGMKKRIQKLKGVEAVEADLKNSEVTVKGVYDPAKLVKYVYKKSGKHAVIVKQEPEPEPELVKETVVEEAKEEEKKGEEGGEKENEGEEKNEKKEEGEAEAQAQAQAQEKEEGVVMVIEEAKVEEPEEEVKIIEYYHNINVLERNGVEMQAYPDYYKIYPPQIFSDENPNACTIM